ncbi:MAG: hypothetical protein COW19_11085 [Zetaproteobacteria bacterium CG12_big_fil_rev_8_21_14_0_65_55_1124]|nr:MAG: hypothetical protein AUJ58_02285 [Zetaproteobacteria bacterium CG1_02_55_237]PIS19006.1 MAG: hypothetical protein COT53_08120 [Zetaproteobacteria bacterium CG08_land_8_20_14_0_20_55_17]PIW41926.1 MAG: hypothetical protein COW19_11085 [Zetaproteobacteria bacterium CG12_big_fil_rev_8_21_14_0_65_55_1124]PIY53544.1 MAG: hypothetical protein COZ01_03630 [Zetaproteobacteria bacterium CG_4_10_14_0_8_um_filter_55_43]PIZ37414.1 MAG: hypothetical protein COY36_09475 [Zetaproteobacteria bacterium 
MKAWTHTIRYSRKAVLLIAMLMVLSCNQEQELNLARAESEAPVVATVTEVPDFAAIKDSNAKKKAFFDFLRPIIKAENAKVAKVRVRMLNISEMIDNGDDVSPEDQQWLLALAKRYHVDMSALDDEEAWLLLKRRVDTVPFRLALAQAANESSWGTSRFAREGRNFFGEWCFTEGCGIVPSRRQEGMTHEVAVFSSVNESVASYLYHINRVDIYAPLRVARYKIHKKGDKPTARELAGGLSGYSERGDAYVESIRQLIRQNFDLMAETAKDIAKAG